MLKSKYSRSLRGTLLVAFFIASSLMLLLPLFSLLKATWDGGVSLRQMAYVSIIVQILVALISPTISLFSPRFSCKGVQVKNHAGCLFAGCLLPVTAWSYAVYEGSVADRLLSKDMQLILFILVYPLHGFHCLVLYYSFFKGITSRFGRLYRPVLPVYH